MSWSTLFEGNRDIISYSFIKDTKNNIYVSGTSDTNTIKINEVEYKKTSENTGGFITKLNENGKIEWFKFIDGIYLQSIYSVSIDTNNNSYITGIASSNIIIDTNQYNKPDESASGFLIKFDKEGNVTWVKWINGSSIEYGYNTVIDSLNDIYVVGASISPSINDSLPTRGLKSTTSSTTNTTNSASTNISRVDCAGYIIKFNPNGDTLWFKWIDGLRYDTAYTITVDSKNNIYVSGSSTSPSLKIDDKEFSRINNNESVYLTKISKDGELEWFKWISGNNTDTVSKVIIDSNDYVYLNGYSFSEYLTIDTINYPRIKDLSIDLSAAYIIRFNNDKVEWFNWIEGPKDIFSYAIVTDRVSNLYLCGTTDSEYIIVNNRKYENKNKNYNSFMMKINQKGKVEWNTWLYNNNISDNLTEIIISDLLIDNDFNIYFNVYTNAKSIYFNNEELLVSTNDMSVLNTFIFKYSMKDLKFNNSTLYIFILTHKKRIYTHLLNLLLFSIFIYSIWLLYKYTI
uniref:Bulb-type lectin domain-containing protein n=1 Tax=viral metagenome TaxID=1070528 RepID=A0A6C0HW39_9ZZZZ